MNQYSAELTSTDEYLALRQTIDSTDDVLVMIRALLDLLALIDRTNHQHPCRTADQGCTP